MELQFMKMQIMEIGLLIIAAYIGGTIAKKLKIGEVVGQILGGIVVGPHFLKLVHNILQHYNAYENSALLKPVYTFFNTDFAKYTEILQSFQFFVFLFLGMIAFSLGEELHRDRLKQVGLSATLICVLQALLTWLLLFLGFWLLFDFNIINSLIIGSIGIATAPALTFILMNKLKIEGSLKNLVANIVVLDDIIEVVFFSIFLSIALFIQKGKELSVFHISGEVAKEIFFACLIGFGIFLILKLTIKRTTASAEQKKELGTYIAKVIAEDPTPSIEMFLILMGVIAMGTAVAMHFHLPFLITAIVAGFLISNFHFHAIFDSLKIGNIMPMFNLVFFAIIGANIEIESFSFDTLGYVIGYLVLRTVGKLFGNWVGCKITGQAQNVTSALPKLMLPQAGMAAVETVLVMTLLKGSGGMRIFNTIIPALVIFELGGAWLSEKTLRKWKDSIFAKKEQTLKKIFLKEQTIFDLTSNRITELDVKSKEEAVIKLAQLLVEDDIISEVVIVTHSVLEREKLVSTGIGNGVAIPHCRTGLVNNAVIACGILTHPIDWDSPDSKPVDLVFLIVTPEKFPDQHLKAIRCISKTLSNVNLKGNKNNVLIKNILMEYRESTKLREERVKVFPLRKLIQNRVIEVNAKTKEETIAQMSQVLVNDGIISSSDLVTSFVLHREKQASTGIGNGISIPHCRTEIIDETVVVVGILNSPIDWISLDEKLVDLVFLIVTPEKFPKQYLNVIKTISTALRSPNFKEDLISAHKRDDLGGYLNKLDKIMGI
jgi:fructose-specific phosphotransferase system IIA component